MTDAEKRLLVALAWMAEQYLRDGDNLDNQAMSAGELALEALAQYGLVTVTHGGRCGSWTEAGKEFLNSN